MSKALVDVEQERVRQSLADVLILPAALLVSVVATAVILPRLDRWVHPPRPAQIAVASLRDGETMWSLMRDCDPTGQGHQWILDVERLNGWRHNHEPRPGERFKVLVYHGAESEGSRAGNADLVIIGDPAAAPDAVGRPRPQEARRGVAAAPYSQTGLASWYTYWTAAHRTLPKGKRVRVTSLEHPERSVSVVIADRGPNVDTARRVIDLHKRDFARLAPPSRGLTRVEITEAREASHDR